MKRMVLLLLLIVAGFGYGQNYVVSGAGANEVNGIYWADGIYNGVTQYRLGLSSIYLRYNDMWGPSRWEIVDLNMWETYYYTNESGPVPPSTGWSTQMMWYEPVPSVAMDGPAIAYSGSTFSESASNNGSISNTLTITCNNSNGVTFTGTAGENFVSGGKVTVTNVPNGLTAVITKVDNVTLTAALTGTAT
ncbi:MAG: hypothetical protein ACOYNS_18185, partial [Bacteroidota bacterium]